MVQRMRAAVRQVQARALRRRAARAYKLRSPVQRESVHAPQKVRRP